jgi:ATP-dependent exoDNAse (exonuclease V) alpha subunit
MGPITEWCRERILPFTFLAFTNSAVDTARARSPGILTKDNARTLHSTLYGAPNKGKFSIGAPQRGALEGVRVVFVDEASLVPSAVMRDLLAVAHRKRIKVVICGDPFQLGAVEEDEGRPFEPLKAPHVAMRHVVRQGADSGVLRLATTIREKQQALAPKDVLPEILPGREEEGAWRFPQTQGGALDLFVALWRRNPGGVAVIVRGNQERVALNMEARERLRSDSQGPLSPDEPLMVLGNTKDLSNGARIKAPEWVRDCEIHAFTFKRFDEGFHREVEEPAFVMISHDPDPETNMRRKLVLFPETLAPSIALMPLVLEQKLPQSELRTLERLCRDAIPVTPYYVGTCHKAQGKEWEEVIVIPPSADAPIRRDPNALARWAYTAITRASKRLYCEALGL